MSDVFDFLEQDGANEELSPTLRSRFGDMPLFDADDFLSHGDLDPVAPTYDIVPPFIQPALDPQIRAAPRPSIKAEPLPPPMIPLPQETQASFLNNHNNDKSVLYTTTSATATINSIANNKSKNTSPKPQSSASRKRKSKSDAVLQPPAKKAMNDDASEQKRQLRLMRNRASAQLSRERKKAYLLTLQNRIEELERSNQALFAEMEKLKNENQVLKARVHSRKSIPEGIEPTTPAQTFFALPQATFGTALFGLALTFTLLFQLFGLNNVMVDNNSYSAASSRPFMGRTLASIEEFDDQSPIMVLPFDFEESPHPELVSKDRSIIPLALPPSDSSSETFDLEIMDVPSETESPGTSLALAVQQDFEILRQKLLNTDALVPALSNNHQMDLQFLKLWLDSTNNSKSSFLFCPSVREFLPFDYSKSNSTSSLQRRNGKLGRLNNNPDIISTVKMWVPTDALSDRWPFTIEENKTKQESSFSEISCTLSSVRHLPSN